MTDFQGLVAVVTGGASGIGAATARLLQGRGARVAVLDRSTDGVPDGVLALGGDVTDTPAIDAAVTEVVERLGGLDVLVNNAGIGAVGDVSQNNDAEWARVLDVNVTGIARVTRAALPHLRQSPHAAVVNTCSAVAFIGVRQRALYGASKGAVLALTLAMAADHASEGIRVNAVAPGTADTRGSPGSSTPPTTPRPLPRHYDGGSPWDAWSAPTRSRTGSPPSHPRSPGRLPARFCGSTAA
jgi:NAD(P)-dependent dehydrogenase (short-subunit alcohol dehydrogenase family)